MNEVSLSGVRISRRSALQMAAASAAGSALMSGQSPAAAGPPPSGDKVEPFRIAVPQRDLDDLHARLRATRMPERETVTDWSQGVPLAEASALIGYWRDRYDWRRCERKLNAFSQYRTTIDGLGIHFLHVRSKHPDALPIIMTHGWPGSIIEFLDVIGPLTDPTAHGGRAEDAFHVVAPSLPGFGWSDKPRATGWSTERIAKAWSVLMPRLGYTRWVAQGGDWGSVITHTLGHQRPPGLVAAHVNLPFVFPDVLPQQPSADEAAAIAAAKVLVNDGFAYFQEQATGPQTLGYGLVDSPAGQAMWIYEKLARWSDSRSKPGDAFTFDQVLDNVTLYWLTASGASSARIYWEQAGHPATLPSIAAFNAGAIDLPMAGSVFPKEFYRAPREWAERHWSNLIYWNEVPRGGHFAAFEQPALFTQELRNAFRTIRHA